MRAFVVVLLFLVPSAAALVPSFGACHVLRPAPEPCVGFRIVESDSVWGSSGVAGVWLFTNAVSFGSWWDDLQGRWPPVPAPDVDFSREWVAAIVEDYGTLSRPHLMDVVTTGEGAYAVTYASAWYPGDIEWSRSGYEIIAVDPAAGAPTDVSFVGQYVWDRRFNP